MWATDDGVARRPGQGDHDPPPLVRLSPHAPQGPGEVTFADPDIEIAEGGPERVESNATFSDAPSSLSNRVAREARGSINDPAASTRPRLARPARPR